MRIDGDITYYVLQHTTGNLYWKDKEGNYLGCNVEFSKVAKLNSPEDIIGKSDRDLFLDSLGEEGISKLIKIDQSVINDNKEIVCEEVGVDGLGNVIFYLTKKVPLYSAQGKVIGLVGNSLDITNLKQTEEKLRQAKEKAEASNRAKTDFLSNMSHDIKTPLSGMISFAELLSLRVQPELQNLLQGLMNSGKQLMSFFENCIELSKVENHSLVSLKENFSLKHLLHEIVQLFQPTILAKGLFLYIEYSEKMPGQLLGNRANLYRILLNLMGNAIKFTSKGFIKITVNLGQKSTEKNAIIRLKIADTGIGIPESKRQLIFEKFSRLTPSYEGIYEGHGIGLYIVQQFVESMGGQIYVKSQEGEGSEFVLAIPFEYSLLADDECEDEGDVDLSNLQVLPQENSDPLIERPLEKIKDLAQEMSTETSKFNILLVEDDMRAQMVARMVLETLDCHVDVADCGEKAIALFKPGKYSLVFMDIGLPDMKGYDVSKHLRAMEEFTSFHVPILGLSAHASHEEKQLSLNAGIEDMFSKPLLVDQARRLLEEYAISESVSLPV